MLDKHLIVKTSPIANPENVVYWQDYRVTVLGDRLFRIEQSPQKKFRDRATQTVWFRNAEKQTFTLGGDAFHAIIDTGACKLVLFKNRCQAYVEFGGNKIRLDNYGNLLGTYRTLDNCDGGTYINRWTEELITYRLQLGKGVCSKTGVAVLDDRNALSLSEDGRVLPEKGDGSDEYVFAYGDDYRGAVRALYQITGAPPLLPRYALGNWWSRYHVYTDEEYLRILNLFEEREIPLTVATIDMDWHYSDSDDPQLNLAGSGKLSPEYLGEPEVIPCWTGYTWNQKLFPDYKAFLKEIQAKDLKITLNLHPADGFRWWEACYADMARAVGQDPATEKQVAFDFTDDTFINAYYSIAHKPYEADGVEFWWIDWQQKDIPWSKKLLAEFGSAEQFEAFDPLWSLNHYHYLDNAKNHAQGLILSRYAGVGSHRYPIGFSGDTEMTWKTLEYLPYFTATASNVGYTWWSHDIGGHNFGEKSDELYARGIQYGVFSPINRLHCACDETMTKEPWMYGNGAGLIAEKFLRFRHRLIPYLYTASYRTNVDGVALIEPLYYEWKQPQAYAYKNEYRFGSELLVAPVTQKSYPDGFARVKAWLPEGEWTDIFTGERYEIPEGGKELTMLRTLDSLPVLAKAGGILPLSADKGNSAKNPEALEIWAYCGNNAYTLYEDGEDGSVLTTFEAKYVEENGESVQTLQITAQGDFAVLPQNRELRIRFKNVRDGECKLFVDGQELAVKKWLTDCAAIKFPFVGGKTYCVEARFKSETRLQKLQSHATDILTRAEEQNQTKIKLWRELMQVETIEAYVETVDGSEVAPIVKQRLKETV